MYRRSTVCAIYAAHDRLHNAAADSAFVYLSNAGDITFDRAWKAAGLSGNSEDYFTPDEAILAELSTI